MTSRGFWGYTLGIVLTAFYIILYWFPEYLGLGSDGKPNQGLVAFFDPLSYFMKGEPASQWFLYGTLYTLAILVFGVKFIWKYRHNRLSERPAMTNAITLSRIRHAAGFSNRGRNRRAP